MPIPVPANLRALAKRPAFTLAAIGIVALGIALATTAASIVDAVVFRSIPVPSPEEIVRVHSGVFSGVLSAPDVRDVIDQGSAPAFSYGHRFSVEYSQENRSGLIVLGEFLGNAFDILQWTPDQGRLLQAGDFLRGSEPVTVVSYLFWKNELAADPKIVGQSINLNGKPFTIVGVLSPEFDRVNRTIRPQVWTALVHTFDDWIYDNRNSHSQVMLARLPASQSIAAYQAELDTINEEIRRAYPDSSSNIALRAEPESVAARGDRSDAVQQSYIIIGLVSALLLTACFNVGNMLLANAYRREREFAIRRSVGASPGQLTRQLLSESMTIAIIGGICGVLLSTWLVTLADQLPFTRWVDVKLDDRSLLIALAATCFTGILSGLAPSIHLARGNVGDSIKQGSKGSHVALAPRILVISQIGLCTILLSATLLYTLSIKASMSLDLGYDPSKLAFFSFSVQSVPEGRREQVSQNLRDEIARVPGVAAASFTTNRLLRRYGWSHIKTDRFHPDTESDKCFSGFNFISNGFLDTLEIPLLEGRDVRDEEASWPFKIAVVNESFVERFFPEGNALGQEFWPWGGSGEDRVRIVGIFKDHVGEPWKDVQPLFFLPQAQSRNIMYIRAEQNPRTIAKSVEAIVLDPKNEYVAEEVEFFSDAQLRAFSDERSALYVLAILAASALLLSSVGIWYTTRQFVRQSRKELSIRLAIGATPASLLSLILKRSFVLVGTGLGAGLALSYVAGRWIQSALNGISLLNPVPYLVTAAALLFIAFVASYLPARAASKSDPRDSLVEV